MVITFLYYYKYKLIGEIIESLRDSGVLTAKCTYEILVCNCEIFSNTNLQKMYIIYSGYVVH